MGDCSRSPISQEGLHCTAPLVGQSEILELIVVEREAWPMVLWKIWWIWHWWIFSMWCWFLGGRWHLLWWLEWHGLLLSTVCSQVGLTRCWHCGIWCRKIFKVLEEACCHPSDGYDVFYAEWFDVLEGLQWDEHQPGTRGMCLAGLWLLGLVVAVAMTEGLDDSWAGWWLVLTMVWVMDWWSWWWERMRWMRYFLYHCPELLQWEKSHLSHHMGFWVQLKCVYAFNHWCPAPWVFCGQAFELCLRGGNPQIQWIEFWGSESF